MPGTAFAIGYRPPHALFERGAERLAALVARAELLGIDHLCTGDHVSFHGGRGAADPDEGLEAVAEVKRLLA